jgi:uncharacterized protein YbaA (DUF1428 family)
MEYVDGFLIPVPRSKKSAYQELATGTSAILREHGALRIVECWIDEEDAATNEFFHGEDARDGLRGAEEAASARFREAAGARPGESVVLAWIEWPNKATRDSGMQAAMEDPRMQFGDGEAIFEGNRLIASGFIPLLKE